MPVEKTLLTTDHWLAGLLRRDAYNLHVDSELIRLVRKREYNKSDSDNLPILFKRRSQPAFAAAKVPTTNLAACHFLEEQGFRLVDTNVTFWKTASAEPQQSVGDKIIFRRAEPDDREAVVDIARRSFRYSRFHLDPVIPDELANEIKATWAENFFNGQRGDEMVVSVADGKICGFALLLAAPKPAFTIDLIAVDPDLQRRGAAAGMIHFAEKLFLDRSPDITLPRVFFVGTQLANQPSIALYEKLGFRMTSSQYVFHYHNPPEYETK